MSNITDLIITIFEDQIDAYYFTRLISYNVHPTNPLHLIGGFKMLGYALTLCHLFYEMFEHFLCLLVDIGKIAVQLAAELQIGEQRSSVFSQIIQVWYELKGDYYLPCLQLPEEEQVHIGIWGQP